MQNIGSKLTSYLHQVQVQGRPFNWASNNCSHFAYGWYVYLGGQMAYPDHALTSRDVIRKSLGDPYAFIAYIERCLNLVSASGAYAAVGDIVLVKIPTLDIIALGICNGDLIACLSDSGGVAFESPERVATWKMPNA